MQSGRCEQNRPRRAVILGHRPLPDFHAADKGKRLLRDWVLLLSGLLLLRSNQKENEVESGLFHRKTTFRGWFRHPN
jgi:hypothetical protein